MVPRLLPLPPLLLPRRNSSVRALPPSQRVLRLLLLLLTSPPKLGLLSVKVLKRRALPLLPLRRPSHCRNHDALLGDHPIHRGNLRLLLLLLVLDLSP